MLADGAMFIAGFLQTHSACSAVILQCYRCPMQLTIDLIMRFLGGDFGAIRAPNLGFWLLALVIRIRFWGPLYYNYIKETPK